MERLGLSRCVISGAIFFLAIGSVGCDDRSSPEMLSLATLRRKLALRDIPTSSSRTALPS